jgi:hypothetical protein
MCFSASGSFQQIPRPLFMQVGTNNHLNRPEKPASTSSRRPALQSTPTFNRGGQASSHQKNSNVGSKPMQRAGGKDDDKLVEMINTTIVDRSPSVKWDDVGMQPLTLFVCSGSSLVFDMVSLFSGLICSWS